MKVIFSNLLTVVTLSAQLTRDLLAIAKFLVNAFHRLVSVCNDHYLGVIGLVAWHSGRTSVFDRRTFVVLRSTYS